MTPFRAMLLVALLFGASCLMFPGAALDPLADDAGSGGDAGDSAFLATPVTPGSFEGRVGGPVDATDWYSFQGAAGDRVTFDVGSDGGDPWPLVVLHGPQAPGALNGDFYAVAVANGFMGEFILPVSGTWYLNAIVNLDQTDPVTYSIDLARTPLDNVFIGGATDPSFALELRMDEPGDVWIWVRSSVTEWHAATPRATTLLRDFTIASPETSFSSSFSGTRLWRTDTGDTWHVGTVGAEGELPLDVVAPEGLGWAQKAFRATETTGSVRFASYFTEHVGKVDFLVWTSGQAEWDSATGGAPVSYRTTDLEDTQLLLPGVAPGGERSLQAHLPARTVGWATGGDAVVEAIAPDLTRYASSGPPHDHMPFYYPDAGNWSLEFDPPAHVANEADRIWFDHVQIPDLGIAKTPFIREPHGPSW